MFVNVLFLVVFLSCLTSCTVNGSSANIDSSKEEVKATVSPTPPVNDESNLQPKPPDQIMSSEKLGCGEIEYDLVKVRNFDRQAYDIKLIQSDGTVKHTINMPARGDFGGFSVNWAKPTPKGFEISVDWGTRIYHDIRFNFVCKQNEFYLSKIAHHTFDKHYPEDLSLYTDRIIPIVPNLPLEKFVITKYLDDLYRQRL